MAEMSPPWSTPTERELQDTGYKNGDLLESAEARCDIQTQRSRNQKPFRAGIIELGGGDLAVEFAFRHRAIAP